MGSQPRTFHYSLDWRFLLPIGDVKSIGLLREQGNEDFAQALEQSGIHVAQQLSLSDLRRKQSNEIRCFVLPFGLPEDEVRANYPDQVALYASIRGVLVSGGYLLIGFNHAWNIRSRPGPKHHPSIPRRLSAQLQQAGFNSITMFGAMPNLAIPEYIFDLDSRTIQFALQNRFRRKPAVLHILRLLAVTIGFKRVANFLPCYYAIATA
jgi:hypothetical protein